jgi:hypothetical protein
LPAYITESVEPEILLRSEYLAAGNRILRNRLETIFAFRSFSQSISGCLLQQICRARCTIRPMAVTAR